ncbi:MAG: cysteine synthase A [Bacteroidales bacterium]|nr:cysteine synthase A [Bacteroidales bacterium]
MTQSLAQQIGNTPLVRVKRQSGQKADIWVKIESFNPGGSVKDRVALEMIEDAERKGIIAPGATLIEPTSGNTGVGLAWVGRLKGYEVILTMPETMSLERRNLLKAYGARLELTAGARGMSGAIERAEELKNSIEGAVILGQFTNPANPLAHEKGTGEEIWRDTEGQVDIFVAGIGTGGTISGCAKALKKHRSDIQIVGFEPASSPFLTQGKSGSHGIQGIGAGFLPETFDASLVDEIVTVEDEVAMEGSRMLAREEGLLVGISSGAAYQVALMLARREENAGKNIVALLPDGGERYLSTGLFSTL